MGLLYLLLGEILGTNTLAPTIGAIYLYTFVPLQLNKLKMKEKLSNVISESGIWKDNRSSSHAFLLSPSVYAISEVQHEELKKLGFSLYDCLIGLSRIACIACSNDLNYRGAWQLIRRVFNTGVPKVYQELQSLNPNHIPRLLKVDLMLDESGNFKIAEIDGHNKHGLGYSTLGLRFRESLYPESKSMIGVVKELSKEVNRHGSDVIKIFYADRERFYLPEFEIAQQEFKKHGIDCLVVSELDATLEFTQSGIFLDLPFLNKNIELYDSIIDSYKKGKVKFVIPPKPFLGSKGVLALLRNDYKDTHLESILNSFIKESSLELLRSYIPETYLIGKEIVNKMPMDAKVGKKNFVLKESISSGMKGIYFSDQEGFTTVLDKAFKAKMNWILQEEVVNQPQSFSWYDSGKELNKANNWFMRVTTHYVNRNLADIIVTARRNKAVHGAKDCLQLGAIIT